MKKFTALFLALLMLLSVAAAYAESPAVPWSDYDNLVLDIKKETNFVKREALMHKAEDMLMHSGAIVPVMYYSDYYLSKPDFKDFYSNVYGHKYFQYATNGAKTSARLNIASEPARLDPALNATVDGAILAILAFGGLLATDADGKTVLHFASDYSVSEDGLTYTITVRDGLQWSDGVPLTAKDFEYSWKRAILPETGADFSKVFDVIKGFEEGNLAVSASEDGKTLTVELANPITYFENLLAFPAYFPVPQHAVEAAEGYKDANGNVVSPGAWAVNAGFPVCGPYNLKEWKHDESMVYEKNPSYFDADKIPLQNLEFMLTADNTTAYAAYQAGNLDFLENLNADELENVMNSPEYTRNPLLGTYYLMFNTKSKLFEGKTVEQASAMRRAFSLLIDREHIVETITKKTFIPANSYVPPSTSDGHGGEFKMSDDAYSYPVAEENGYHTLAKTDDSIAKAVELLKEAGYEFDENNVLSPNTPINFEFMYNTSNLHENVGQTMQNDFAELGINLSMKNLDWAIYLDERKEGNYDMCRGAWIADYNDPINFLEVWVTDGGNNDAQLGR